MNIMLHLKSPIQSWGDHTNSMTKGQNRGTSPFPTYSGVFGLVCSCMGINQVRNPVKYTDLYNNFSYVGAYSKTRINLMTDFQVMGSGYNGNNQYKKCMGKKSSKGSLRGTGYVNQARLIDGHELTVGTLSHRDYITSSEFMVIIQVDDSVATSVINALKNPKWIPVLGRSHCIPSNRILFNYNDTINNMINSIKKYWKYNENDKLLSYVSSKPNNRYSKLDIYDIPDINIQYKYHHRYIYKSFI